MVRERATCPFLDHAREYAIYAWDDVAAKSRVSVIETLSRESSQSSPAICITAGLRKFLHVITILPTALEWIPVLSPDLRERGYRYAFEPGVCGGRPCGRRVRW